MYIELLSLPELHAYSQCTMPILGHLQFKKSIYKASTCIQDQNTRDRKGLRVDSPCDNLFQTVIDE